MDDNNDSVKTPQPETPAMTERESVKTCLFSENGALATGNKGALPENPKKTEEADAKPVANTSKKTDNAKPTNDGAKAKKKSRKRRAVKKAAPKRAKKKIVQQDSDDGGYTDDTDEVIRQIFAYAPTSSDEEDIVSNSDPQRRKFYIKLPTVNQPLLARQNAGGATAVGAEALEKNQVKPAKQVTKPSKPKSQAMEKTASKGMGAKNDQPSKDAKNAIATPKEAGETQQNALNGNGMKASSAKTINMKCRKVRVRVQKLDWNLYASGNVPANILEQKLLDRPKSASVAMAPSKNASAPLGKPPSAKSSGAAAKALSTKSFAASVKTPSAKAPLNKNGSGAAAKAPPKKKAFTVPPSVFVTGRSLATAGILASLKSRPIMSDALKSYVIPKKSAAKARAVNAAATPTPTAMAPANQPPLPNTTPQEYTYSPGVQKIEVFGKLPPPVQAVDLSVIEDAVQRMRISDNIAIKRRATNDFVDDNVKLRKEQMKPLDDPEI